MVALAATPLIPNVSAWVALWVLAVLVIAMDLTENRRIVDSQLDGSIQT
jgi:hypothetical protein